MLALYISDEAKAKREETLDTSRWERLFPLDIPRQDNGCDCGVFTVKFGDYLVRALLARRGAAIISGRCLWPPVTVCCAPLKGRRDRFA